MRIFYKDTDRIPEVPPGRATAYRLAGQHPEYDGPHKLRVSPDHLHGCRIVERRIMPETDSDAVRKLLTNIKIYGDRGLGARCYTPGFAFTFGENAAAVDVLVCLQCRWVVFHRGDQSVSLVPTEKGLARLREIYQTLIERPQTHLSAL